MRNYSIPRNVVHLLVIILVSSIVLLIWSHESVFGDKWSTYHKSIMSAIDFKNSKDIQTQTKPYKPPKPNITTSTTDPPVDDNKKLKIDQRGFWKGKDAKNEHRFDKALAASLVKFLKKEKVKTILELGSGSGQYAQKIQEAEIFISCYDGNPQTQDISNGRCGVLDFSKPLKLHPHEWVLSFEVGEHIPKQFEDIFINNIHKLNLKGVILSWAVVGQTGLSHVNNHNNDYIRNKFGSLGYKSDVSAENILRNSTKTSNWFRRTIMIFRRKK